ncbi:hypothetical protein [Pectinatus haikarae]|uniref:Uncharacterized protein n=1 Tax=Pectinatus haikarae TaxID=349096 RepID=A0ABT9Y4V7_9FIRM|nr:hypothetical protein [Pectinatus haikarae]MDQ0202866.1 hypothetical protein [Pectinatus haikarae]
MIKNNLSSIVLSVNEEICPIIEFTAQYIPVNTGDRQDNKTN